MKIQILISTYNEGIFQVEKVLLPPMEELSYLISHQCTDENRYGVPPGLCRPDVLVSAFPGTGISSNRNHAIRKATGEVVVLMDDDVRLKPEYIQHIRHIFETNPEIDIACTKIKTFDGEPEYKIYPVTERPLQSIRQLKAVSSIEIAFRLASVRGNMLEFDERFGLGAKVRSGEELLFLNNCLKRGLRITFFPVYTVEHPFQSSTKKQSAYSDERLFATGAQNYVLYGRIAFIISLLAVFRRYTSLRKEGISPLHFLKMKWKGSSYISKSRN